MSVSLWILTIILLLLMFGAGQRVLDQMRLNDKQAIITIVAIIIGLIIPPIYIGKCLSFSIGGFLVPLIVCVYMLMSAGKRDNLRALFGTLLVGIIIYALDWLMPAESPEDVIIDPMFIYGIVAGVIAYCLGRSRRNALVCSVFGISLSMIVQFVINLCLGAPTVLGLGVGGAFGTMIVSSVIAVGLCEFLGRAFESANPDKEKKVYNYETRSYDSEKNGRLNEDGSRVLVVAKGNDKSSEKLTTQNVVNNKNNVVVDKKTTSKPKASKNNSIRTNKVEKR